MAVKRERFELALSQLEPSDWSAFEKCASQFLLLDFPELVSVGTASGDRGRDAQIWRPSGESNVLIQYSVTPDWEGKIRSTRQRIEQEFHDANVLIFVSPQKIGAKADEFKRNMRKGGLSIDIRDRGWLADRVNVDSVTSEAAESLAALKVDPLLSSKGIIAASSSAFSSTEEKTAFFYISLQLEDDTRQKGLTKVAFDALVKAALSGTHSENRMSRTEIHNRVHAFLQSHSIDRVCALTDSALSRLNKSAIRSWQKNDEFCLSHQEVEHQAFLHTQRLVCENNLNDEIKQIIEDIDCHDPIEVSDMCRRSRRVLDAYLLKKGEEFARAVVNDDLLSIFNEDIKSVIERDISDYPPAKRDRSLVDKIKNIILDVAESPSEYVSQHIQYLSESHTLMAFLRETPDIQSVTKKLFSFGDVWLDTSFILPAMVEEVYGVDYRQFSSILKAANNFGIKLYITDGVIEEIYKHFTRCFAFMSATQQWSGDVPFAYSAYIGAGKSSNTFRGWAENFFGNERPEQDIADYLLAEFQIEVANLTNEVTSAPDELRAAVQEGWYRVHQGRRETDHFDMVRNRLIEHDVENYLGVIQKRNSEGIDKVLGYKTWWLTLDGAVTKVHKYVAGACASKALSFPVMSIDFFVRYLEFGPQRSAMKGKNISPLPLILDSGISSTPPELLAVAAEARRSASALPEHRIRRRVRDSLDKARATFGELHGGGVEGLRNGNWKTTQ